MKIAKLLLLLELLVLISCNKDYSSSKNDYSKLINQKLDQVSKSSLKLQEKQEILQDAYNLANEQEDDIRNKNLLEISYQFLKLRDSVAFLTINKKVRKLSADSNDSLSLAMAYWDLGNYYHTTNIEDSAYFYYNNAQKLYALVGNEFNSGRLLLNMAMIQKNIKDYTGSEVTTTNAITLLKPLHKNKQLYSAYNNLGIVFNELEEFDKALNYYEEAQNYLEKSERADKFPSIWNNIGVVLHNKKQFDKANDYYNKALNYRKDLANVDPELYAMLLDNQAYNRLRAGEKKEILEQLQKSLQIRKKHRFIPGIVINQLHLAEYFIKNSDTISAINYASRAKELSMQTSNTRDLINSLIFLSHVKKDSSLFYTRKVLNISDSLQKHERAVRNKFARINFETNEYISETERLNQRIFRISLMTLGILLIFILLYIIKDQRSKNKLIRQKESANQEIYNLILAQQKYFEEGREKEKQHISRELHDGILGKLFGIRLSLDSLNERDEVESKKKRFHYIEEIQKIAEEIRLISHKLNKNSIVDVDFKTVLEELIKNQHQGVDFQLQMENSIFWEDIGNDIKINIYRIIQEAINNIHRHSKATKAKIEIRKNKKKIILHIRDNGVGFNSDESTTGIGLKNMKDRSRNIDGHFSIKSGPQGTLIKVTINIKNEK
ncbi:tetratricopeptide repeat protein [Zunongwangia sp. H14]|uniref:tetratricopeptide repeat-containing sensor histidine kinase n=1 Tax=Zunongwangia sp. H14 TaxID=3240792 RepID=UPI00356902F6